MTQTGCDSSCRDPRAETNKQAAGANRRSVTVTAQSPHPGPRHVVTSANRQRRIENTGSSHLVPTASDRIVGQTLMEAELLCSTRER